MASKFRKVTSKGEEAAVYDVEKTKGNSYNAPNRAFIRKLKGEPLEIKGVYQELETGCNRAIPDNDNAAQKIEEFFVPKKRIFLVIIKLIKLLRI